MSDLELRNWRQPSGVSDEDWCLLMERWQREITRWRRANHLRPDNLPLPTVQRQRFAGREDCRG